jgi:hypothetical protein
LRRCANLAGTLFTDLVRDASKWAEAIRVERNEVAHQLGKLITSDRSQTYYLWQSVYWLFVMCMMRDCDAPDEVFDHMRQHGEYQWLAPRIQAII